MSIETLPYHLRVGSRRAFSGHDDEIERCQVELPERFARYALESVSIDRSFRRSAGDSQAQARARAQTRSGKHCEVAVGRTVGLGEDSRELCGARQPPTAGECCLRRQPGLTDNEALVKDKGASALSRVGC